ncbi:hypothetical protein BJV78DRAFT_1247369 [Lactifluus subvellereus]|nr:hypothetical protein BJV78DRAFT_1247369 [Lactifluus subvellereus]
MLPFCLFIGIPVLALLRFSKFNASSATHVLFSWLLVAFLIFVHPEKWRVWNRMWVWPPIRRFFQKYGSNYPTRRRYRLPGKAGFIIGLLSGLLLTGFLPLVLMQHFLYVRSRSLPVESP